MSWMGALSRPAWLAGWIPNVLVSKNIISDKVGHFMEKQTAQTFYLS